MRSKKIQVAMIAVICVGIILAGTFAWFSFTQQALNIFEGWTNPDVNLHDDFDEPNKDVYVENSGQRPLYVRVKFDEYMEIDGNSIMSEESALRNNLETWITHAYQGVLGPEICLEDIHEYYKWIMGNATGDPDKGAKYYLLAPFENRALFDETGVQLRNPIAVEFKDDQEYYGFDDGQGGYEWLTLKEAYARIDDLMKEELTEATPFTTPTYVTANPTAPVAPFNGTSATNLDYVNWLYSVIDFDDSLVTNSGSQGRIAADKASAQAALNTFLRATGIGYYQMSYTVNSRASVEGGTATYDDMYLEGQTTTELVGSGYISEDKIEFVPVARTAKTTQVYTMAQWIAAGMPTGNYWVMDTDGWCYWADVLLPSQTTGLLLSEVLLDELNPPNGVWWYGINVSLQAVTAEDILRFGLESGIDGTYGGGFTEQGEMLLNAISGKYVYGVSTADTVDGLGNALKSDATLYTYEKFGDNTYRLRTADGQTVTYGPLFVYTGNTGSSVSAMTKLYTAFQPGSTVYENFVDNSEYKIGTEFWKLAKVNPETWIKFTVVDADDEGTFDSGVLQASNGKRYIKLSYTGQPANTTAWMAVGTDGEFGTLLTTGAPAGLTSTSGYVTGNKFSNNDDLLIWTEAAQPGIDDRYTEVADTKSLKVGDTFTADGFDWIVIGKDAGVITDLDDDKTLIISKNVLAQMAYAGTAAALEAYAKGDGTGSLTALVGADNDAEAILLSAADAIDYFASNTNRTAVYNDAASKWWLEDGTSAVDLTGGFTAPEVTDATVGLRPALWIDSDELYTLLFPSTP